MRLSFSRGEGGFKSSALLHVLDDKKSAVVPSRLFRGSGSMFYNTVIMLLRWLDCVGNNDVMKIYYYVARSS